MRQRPARGAARKAVAAAVGLCGALGLAGGARAEESGDVAGSTLALELLGANELTVIRPGSVGAVLSESRALAQDGRLTPGIGIEVSPWTLGIGAHTTYEELRQRTLRYQLSRSSLSVGTVADPSLPGAVRSAAALRVRLWDQNDWRLNTAAIECARTVVRPPAAPDAPPIDGVVVAPPLSDAELAALGRCLAQHQRWNASQGSVGIGATAFSPDGKMSSLTADSVQAWVGAGFGAGQSVQVMASARYLYQMSRDAAGMTPAAPSRQLVGAGASAAAKLSRLIFLAEGAAGWQRAGGQDDTRLAASGAVQIDISGGVWFELRYEYTRTAGVGGSSGGGNLRWSYDPTPGSR